MSVRVRLNRRAFEELRRSPAVVQIIQQQADTIASSAGEGFETRPLELGRGRVRVAVVTAGFKAMLSEAYHRTLTRAAGGAGTRGDVWTRRR